MSKGKCNRFWVILLAFVLSMVPVRVLNASEGDESGLNVAYHTQEEVQAFLDSHPAPLRQEVTYETAPSLEEPYSAGVLSQETLWSALNMLNQCRYIAGVNAAVTLDDSYSEYASAATLLNRLNGRLSHSPTRPEVLADSSYDTLYSTGYTGASKSNLGMGYSNLNQDIINGWMADYDSSNIDRVGHRRWVINPKMQKVGFGVTGSYYAMYALDRSGSGGETCVAWPAQTMPVQYFHVSYPWSLSVGSIVDADNVQVTLVRRADEMTCAKSWNFSSADADGYFNVNNDGYGQVGCIIFRPDGMDSISDGDIFDVTVSLDNGATVISYTVTFFAAELTQVAGGTCDENENLSWGLDEFGVLNISGEGRMEDYLSGAETPWYDYGSRARSIIIGDGITSIGKNTFWNYGMTNVKIPDSVTEIGEQAFRTCYNLTSVTIPGSVTSISDLAFRFCDKLTTICGYPGTAAETYAQEKGLEFVSIGHSWDEGLEIKEATCTKEGIKTYTCTECGYTYTGAASALGHDWGEWTVVKEATVQEEGREQRVCARCNETETRVIAKLDPNPVDKTALEAVIAEAEGLKEADYTEESFAALTEALDAAKAVNDKEDAVQADVDAAKEALQTAIDGVVEKEEPVTPDEEVCRIFADVTHGSWYEDAIQYVYDKGLMEGNEDKFTPNGQMTRGMFVTTLYRLAGEPEVTDRSACTELHDVGTNAWYTDAVCWAYANKITTGYENDMTFRTSIALSREQLATFLYRYADYEGMDISASDDLTGLLNADKVKPYAEKEVKWAVGAGMINGMEIKDEAGNTVYDLAPQKTATRAQMAQILRNFCEAYDI